VIRKRLLAGYTTAILVYMLLPIALAVPLSLSAAEFMTFPPQGLSFHWYEEFFTQPEWTRPTLFSLALGVASATIATVVGGMAAWPLTRHRFPGRDILGAVLGAPLVVPPITVAVGSFLVWANLRLLGSPVSLVTTHVVLIAGYVLLVVGAALSDFDDTQIKAARSLGAGGWTIARRIVIPQIMPAVAASWLLAFIASVDEVVITRFLLTAGQVQTLAVHILNQLRQSISPVIPASSVILGLLAIGVAVAISRVRKTDDRDGVTLPF
jgi:putative spermidine/putrescine transport system permease protein